MRRVTTLVVAALLFFSQIGSVAAEPPFLGTRSAIPIDQNRYRFDGGLRFDQFAVGRQTTALPFSFVYGLIHNLEVGAHLPYLFAREKTQSRDQLGDVTLLTKVRFLKGRDAAPISLASVIEIKVPSAPRNAILDTTGEADVGLSLIASKAIFPYQAHINLVHTFIGNPPRSERPDRRDYALGLEYEIDKSDLTLTGEVLGSVDDALYTNDRWLIAGGASLRMPQKITLDSTLGFGLSRRAPDYVFQVRLSVNYP